MSTDKEWNDKLVKIGASPDMQSFYDMLEDMATILDMIVALDTLKIGDNNQNKNMEFMDAAARYKSLRRNFRR